MLAIKIDTIANYKRVCDKLHKMWYTRQSKKNLNEYYFIDRFAMGGRTMYSDASDWLCFWRTRMEMGWIPAKKFLLEYDL